MLTAVAAFAVGLAVVACGGSSSNGEASKSAQQIFTDAQQATGAASSAQVSGTITSSGTTVQLDVVAGQGSGGGTVNASGASFQIILNHQDVYLKADAATWTKLSNPTAAQLLAGRWIKTTTANQDFADLANLLDISKLATALTPSGALTKGSPTTFNKVAVVPLHDTGANQGTLYVATTGKPYMIAVRGGGTQSGTVTFSQYGTAKVPSPPSGAIDLSQLQQSAGT